jgi:iron complex outermembrane recepter protein
MRIPKYFPYLFLLFLLPSVTFSQTNLKGSIVDKQTKQPVEGASVIVQGKRVTTSDSTGSFTLSTKSSISSFMVVRLGYTKQTVEIPANAVTIAVELETQSSSKEVLVQGASNPAAQARPDAAISVLTPYDLTRSTGLSLQDAVNLIPGVNMEARTPFGGQRFTIRGVGGNTGTSISSDFSPTGYKVYLDGVPITDATGLTLMDDVDNANIGGVSIIKGPASTLYGNGIGGVVQLYTLQPTPGQQDISEDYLAGSHGLMRWDNRIEDGTDNNALLMNYGKQHDDGPRAHSASDKSYVSFTDQYSASEKQTISVFGNYSDSYEQYGGEEPDSMFMNRLNWDDPNYVQANAHEAIESFRGGATDNYQFSNNFGNTSSLFFDGYTLNSANGAHRGNPSPIDSPATKPSQGTSDNNVFTFGARSVFNYQYSNSSITLNGVGGVEFDKTDEFTKGYGYTGGVLGAISSDLQINAIQTSPFTQWVLTLPDQWSVTGGVSINYSQYNIQDMLNPPDTSSTISKNKNSSVYKVFTPVPMPHIDIAKQFGDNTTVYADFSEGYTPPTTSTVVIPALDEVNSGLQPEKGIQYEIGVKGTALDNRLSYQADVFDLILSNAFETEADSGTTITVNSPAEQDNKGLEASIGYALMDDPSQTISFVRPWANIAYSSFTYKNLKATNNATDTAATDNYNGNAVEGVPQKVINAGLDINTKFGLYFNATWNYNDAMPMNYQNTIYAPAYYLINMKIGYKTIIADVISVNIYVGANNLTNELYYSEAILNPMPYVDLQGHGVPGATTPQTQDALFIPGYATTWYGGVTIKWLF